MTREEALAIVLEAPRDAQTSDMKKTLAMAHELLQSPATDLGTPQQVRGEADLAVENYVVTGSTDTGEILTVNALLAECSTAAAIIDEMCGETNVNWNDDTEETYKHLRDRRERLMGSRSSLNTDKGEGEEDRAS